MTVEKISIMVRHLLHHSNWFATLIERIIEGNSGGGEPKQIVYKKEESMSCSRGNPSKGRNYESTNLEEKKRAICVVYCNKLNFFKFTLAGVRQS